jgi:hypothetical protein
MFAGLEEKVIQKPDAILSIEEKRTILHALLSPPLWERHNHFEQYRRHHY